jgi:hypothetical protein
MDQQLHPISERAQDTTDSDAAGTDAADCALPGEPVSGRRSLLRTVALGAAAGVAGVAVVGRQAAAADGDAIAAGGTEDHTSPTNVNYLGPTTAASFNVQSGDQTAANDGILNGAFGSAGTAFLGVASGNGQQNIGVTGWSKKPNGTGIVGFTGGAGAYGGEFFGGLAEVRLRPGGAPPLTLANAHQVGELYEDETGGLWLCVAAGTPGSWRQIAGPTTAGAFTPINPARVHDTRNGGSKLAAGEERAVSVTTSIFGPSVVPVGATAVTMTLTVTQTEGAGGFLSVRPQGAAYQGTSSINWFGAGQNLATTVVSALGGDRQVVVRGGDASTHFIVDVVGFYG